MENLSKEIWEMKHLSNEEIMVIMDKPKSQDLMAEYQQIWLQITGKKFKPSNCCGTFTRLYSMCENYARKIRREIK